MSEIKVARNIATASQAFAAFLKTIDELDGIRMGNTNGLMSGFRTEEKDDPAVLAYNELGKFDPEMARQNVEYRKIDYQMAKPLEQELIKAGVTFNKINGVEVVQGEGMDNQAKINCWYFTRTDQRELVQSVIDEFIRKAPEHTAMEPEELAGWIKETGGDVTRAASIEISRDLYDFMKQQAMISVPFTEMGGDSVDNTVKLRTSFEMGPGVLETVKMAETLFTGGFKENYLETERNREKNIQDIVSGAKDNLHLGIIINTESPAFYIRMDKEGFQMCVDTDQGHYVCDRAVRSDRDYEQKFYDCLKTFGGQREVIGKEEDTQRILHEMQRSGQEFAGMSSRECVNRLKQEHIDAIMEACDIIGKTYQKTDKSRMIDDTLKIESKRDELSARGLGNSDQAGQLRGDLSQIRSMISASVASEMTKDLSDLYDEPAWTKALEKKLCLESHTAEYRMQKMEIMHEMIEHIAKQPPEVQKEFAQELDNTIREVFDNYYRYNTKEIEIEEVNLSEEIRTYDRNELEVSISR